MLSLSACAECPKKCCPKEADDWLMLRFYPHEVKRGLHLRFPYLVLSVEGVELVVMNPREDCPYYVDGLCKLYGTDEMPLDCRIYPAVPVEGGIAIDYVGCPMAKYFDNEEYKRKVLELLKPFMPLDNAWVRAYWKVVE
jgi:Fe-S-cluster containining protein